MKKLYLLIGILGTGLLLIIFRGFFVEQNRVKKFGGSMTVKLPIGDKFINATWKEEELWYITRKRKSGEDVETYIFKEKSKLGLMQGNVIFKEQ